MPTITLSDACIAELKAALALPNAPSPRPTPDPPNVPAQPPVVSGDWQAQAREAAARQGYEPVTLYEWDWSSTVPNVDFSTQQARGVIVVSFIATPPADVNNLAALVGIGYPVNQGCQIKASLSRLPVDFTAPYPGVSISDSPTITYGVGTVPEQWWSHQPTAVALEPGVRYFWNLTVRDTYDPADSRGAGVRIQLQKPSGH